MSKLALPMSWEPLPGAPSHEECESAASANASVLGFLLHSVDLEAAERPADEKLAEALRPLRIKLDILIELLGQFTYRNVALPPTRDVEFGLGRLCWHSPTRLRPDAWLAVKLYFDAKFREPIVLYARVASAITDNAAGGCGVQAELVEFTRETEEALTRLAFLTQRRQLAHRATHTGGSAP